MEGSDLKRQPGIFFNSPINESEYQNAIGNSAFSEKASQ